MGGLGSGDEGGPTAGVRGVLAVLPCARTGRCGARGFLGYRLLQNYYK